LNRLLKLIKNNILLITRSKSSATIIFLGPLIVLILVAIVFNSQGFYSVKIAYSQDADTQITTEIIKTIQNQNFIMEKSNNDENCIQAVKQGIANLCVTFKGDFEIKEEMENNIEVYADYSQLNLAWVVIETISKEIEDTSANISTNIVEVLLEKIDTTKKQILISQDTLNEINKKSKNIQKENLNNIEEEINKINLEFKVQDVPTNNIIKVNTENENKILVLMQNTREVFSDMKLKINRQVLNETEKEKTLLYINQSENKFNTLAGQIMEKKGDVENITLGIQNDLEALEEKLKKSKEKIVNIDEEKIKINQNLNEINNLTEKLNTSMEGIYQNLNSLEITNSEKIAMPIKTNLNPIMQEKTHINYIFPGIIVLLIMFISLFFASSLMIMEKNSKAYMRNLLTPVHDVVFIISNYITSLIIVMFQVMTIFLLLKLFDLIVFSGSIFLLIIVIFISSTLFILTGMCLGYIFSTPQGSIISSLSVSGVLLLLSGLMIPIEAIPKKMATLIEFNPFLITLDAIRKIMFYSFEFSNISRNLNYLILMIIPLFILVIYLHDKFYRENLIFKRKKN
jgi:ABC-type multidrug transport system permease subunit